jgi:hypothetical protein
MAAIRPDIIDHDAAESSRVADRLLIADSGLVRLHTALRLALTCLLTGVASVAWTAVHHPRPILAAPGILFAVIAPLFMRDSRQSAGFGPLLVLYLCACASFTTAATGRTC